MTDTKKIGGIFKTGKLLALLPVPAFIFGICSFALFCAFNGNTALITAYVLTLLLQPVTAGIFMVMSAMSVAIMYKAKQAELKNAGIWHMFTLIELIFTATYVLWTVGFWHSL